MFKKVIGAIALMVMFSQSAIASEFMVKEGVYGKTVEGWAYGMAVHELKGDTLIDIIPGNGATDRYHKNKKRSTIIYVSEGFNPLRPAEVILFFHGLNGFKNFERREAAAVRFMERSQDRNFVLVMPELPWSHHTSTPRKRQGLAWYGSEKENIITFYQEVISRVHVDFGIETFRVGKLTIVGHSAGGSAIMRAAKSGGLNALQPNEIIFSDAGYGRWTDISWYYHGKKNPRTKYILLVRSRDTPHQNTMRFLKTFRKQPDNIYLKVFPRKSWTHTRIGNESLTWHGENNTICGKNTCLPFH